MSAAGILLITGGGRGVGAAVGRLAAVRGRAVALGDQQRGDAAEAVASFVTGAVLDVSGGGFLVGGAPAQAAPGFEPGLETALVAEP